MEHLQITPPCLRVAPGWAGSTYNLPSILHGCFSAFTISACFPHETNHSLFHSVKSCFVAFLIPTTDHYTMNVLQRMSALLATRKPPFACQEPTEIKPPLCAVRDPSAFKASLVLGVKDTCLPIWDASWQVCFPVTTSVSPSSQDIA